MANFVTLSFNVSDLCAIGASFDQPLARLLHNHNSPIDVSNGVWTGWIQLPSLRPDVIVWDAVDNEERPADLAVRLVNGQEPNPVPGHSLLPCLGAIPAGQTACEWSREFAPPCRDVSPVFVAVSGAIFHRDQVLLIRKWGRLPRDAPPATPRQPDSVWLLPTGMMEHGQDRSLWETLRREVGEETGLVVPSTPTRCRRAGLLCLLDSAMGSPLRRHNGMFVVGVRLPSLPDNLTLTRPADYNPEVYEAAWHSVDKLLELPTTPGMRAVAMDPAFSFSASARRHFALPVFSR